MKAIKYLLFISIIFPLFYMSCDKPLGVERVWSFWISNQYEETIYYNVSFNYPDTSIRFEYGTVRRCLVDQKKPYDVDQPWEELFDELPADTLSIFIFSSDTVQKYDWEKIKEDYNILKRFDLSYQDLVDNDWTISYP